MLRVGVAGTGAWARRTHLPALAQHAGIELVGVWGRDAVRARELSAEFGGTPFDSFHQLVEEVDVVDVALAPMVQAGFAMEAATAGRHLLLEKPLAMTGSEAEELSHAVDERGVVARTFLSRLFDQRRRAWLVESAHGEWKEADLAWNSKGLLDSSPAAKGWRAAAGPLFDVGPHVISQLEMLLGEVTDIDAVTVDELGAVDLSLVHRSGARSISHIDLRSRVRFTRETISLSSPARESSWSNEGEVDFVGAFRLFVDDLIDGVNGREPANRMVSTLSGTADGARVVAVLEGIESALESALTS